MTNNIEIDETSDRWAINESLLQSYRSIFIAAQSIFMSAAALTMASWLNLVIVAIAIIQLGIGFTIVRARAKIVDYYKFKLYTKGITERQYVHDKAIRSKYNIEIVNKTNWRATRTKVDVYIPVTFLFIWICFLIKYFTSLPITC